MTTAAAPSPLPGSQSRQSSRPPAYRHAPVSGSRRRRAARLAYRSRSRRVDCRRAAPAIRRSRQAPFPAGVLPPPHAATDRCRVGNLRAVARQPDMRRFVDEIAGGKDRAIHLFGKLGDVTSVDENDSLPLRHERHAGRSGEAGEPGQALGRGRHVFTLIFVGTGDEKTVNAEICEFRPERADAIAAELRGGLHFEGLEHEVVFPGCLIPRGRTMLADLRRTLPDGPDER